MNREALKEWAEKLFLRVLPYDIYLRCSEEESAYIVLSYFEKSPVRSWGWSWSSWLTTLLDGDEFYNFSSHEEKKKFDKELYEYIKSLSEKIPQEKTSELEEIVKKIR